MYEVINENQPDEASALDEESQEFSCGRPAAMRDSLIGKFMTVSGMLGLVVGFYILGNTESFSHILGLLPQPAKPHKESAKFDAGISELTDAAMKCPGSGATTHAGMKLIAMANASCSDVKAEAKARVAGQNGWVDPHNRGTYTEGSYGGSMSFKRHTGDAKFTDKMVFTLTDDGPRCKIEACSESQGRSFGDYSTNYCNLKMLFCGSSDECYPVIHDFTSSDETTTAIAGGSAKSTDCFNGPQA